MCKSEKSETKSENGKMYNDEGQALKECGNPFCAKLLPATLEFFYSHKRTKDGLYPVCRKCRNDRANKRNKKNKKKVLTR